MLNVLEFVQQRRGQLGPPRSRRFVRAGLRESRPALSGLRKQRTFWGQPERTLSRATGLRTPDELQLAALLLIMLAASHSSHRYPALPSRSAPPQHALETPQGPAKLTQPAVARPPSFARLAAEPRCSTAFQLRRRQLLRVCGVQIYQRGPQVRHSPPRSTRAVR